MREGGLDEARRVWIARNTGLEEPDGIWEDQTGKIIEVKPPPGLLYTRYNWKPAESELTSCCKRVHMLHHHSLYDHCRSAGHIGKLYDVDGNAVYEAVAAIEMMALLNPTKTNNALAGAIAWLDEYDQNRKDSSIKASV